MARYIDADALIKKIFPYDVVDKKCYAINAKMIYEAIREAPTADVGEAEELLSENESLGKTLIEANELIRKLRSKVKKSKSEVAREIIDEFMSAMRVKHEENRPKYGGALALLLPDIEQIAAELKKKYTES